MARYRFERCESKLALRLVREEDEPLADIPIFGDGGPICQSPPLKCNIPYIVTVTAPSDGSGVFVYTEIKGWHAE